MNKSKFIPGTYRFTLEVEDKNSRSDSKISVFYYPIKTRKSAENILDVAIKAFEALGLSVKAYGWEYL